MTLPTNFSLLHSELNEFLFAPLGDEENGVPLSVLSALTRLDMDPWAEAARLSALPKDAVVRALVPVIGRFPVEHRTSAQVGEIAARLAELLPHRPALASVDAGIARLRQPRPPAIWLVGLGLVAAVATMAALGMLPWQ